MGCAMRGEQRLGDLIRGSRRSQRLAGAILRWRAIIQFATIIGVFIGGLVFQWGALFFIILAISVLLILSIHRLRRSLDSHGLREGAPNRPR